MLNAENFITDFKGTGGNIRCSNEDFYVEEVPLSLPTGQGPNTWIEILKNGKTTLDVVLDVARHLRLSRKRMGFAGMKDKSAVTRQWICVSNITPEELPDDLEDTLYNVKILDIKSNQRKLRIGQLKGNKFKIAIRGIDDCDEACTNAESVLDSLEITGVPNYYGFQRFGELRCNTHLVGKALVEGNIKKAVDTYIGNPAEGEYSQAYQSRQLYDEGKSFDEIKTITVPCLMVMVRNSFDGVVAFDENNIPISPKKGHGFGTHSIVTFCEKNRIFYEFKTEEQDFILKVIFQ